MSGQTEFNFDIVRKLEFDHSVSRGAKGFLYRAVKDFYKWYDNFPLHIRINMKANSISPKAIFHGSNRVTRSLRDLKENETLCDYYANIRINAFKIENYVCFHDHRFLTPEKKNMIYAIIMKTVGMDWKKRGKIIDDYIHTGKVNIQNALKIKK